VFCERRATPHIPAHTLVRMVITRGFTVEPASLNRPNQLFPMPQRSVFCIALSRGRAGRIVLDLKEARFSNTEISALFLDQSATADRALASGAVSSAGDPLVQPANVINGVMSWIAAVACHVVPGADPIIAAGPMAAALSDAPVCGVADGLIDFGLPQMEARRYAGRIKDGQILVSVHTESTDKNDRAREIFTAAGAEDICTLEEVSVSE